MSRPNQVRMMLVLAFVLTLVAGAVVGAAFMRSGVIETKTNPPSSDPVQHVVSTPATTPATNPSAHNGREWFARSLSLSTSQQLEWTKIWKDSPHEQFRKIGEQERQCYQKRDDSIRVLYSSEQESERDRLSQECRSKIGELIRERDKAIAALYTADQKTERERLEKECSARVSELRTERERLLQPMVDKSRGILTDDQRKRFDVMLKGPGPGDIRSPSSMGTSDRHRGGNDRGGNERGGDRGNSPPVGPPPGRRGPSTQPSTRPFGAAGFSPVPPPPPGDPR